MKNIVLIGSGNVATHLGLSLVNRGYKIKQVWSKQLKNADILAKKLNSTSIDNLNKLKNADLYVVAVKDDALESVTQQLNVKNIIHTSGSIGLEVFNNKCKNSGVFYPLQTFNKEISLDFSKTPICIEANNKLFKNKLINIGNNLSDKVVTMSSEQRKRLHIAAVFACNFTNHMFSLSDTILAKSNIDFKLLLPLINQTVRKINQKKPSEVQTGPAKRKDKKVIQSHINSISDKKTKEIYKLISNSILKNND
jgi:predicted short-subunit dehydrogenase-like oxidoreductase (DUF2520 family)